MSVISMKNLLEAGVHFGHQAKRWNPKMSPYIYSERNGVHIIDLQKTVERGEVAYNFVRDQVMGGAKLLFVGTKKQAQESLIEEAKRSGSFYIAHRWVGGMLTNFSTIKKNILRLKKLEKMEVDGTFASLTKKERSRLLKEKNRLDYFLGGIKEMNRLPDVVFIVDIVRECIAVKEARKLEIPVVAILDSNCDPYLVDYPIPGNDDAIRAIHLFSKIIADAVLEGETLRGKKLAESISEKQIDLSKEKSSEDPDLKQDDLKQDERKNGQKLESLDPEEKESKDLLTPTDPYKGSVDQADDHKTDDQEIKETLQKENKESTDHSETESVQTESVETELVEPKLVEIESKEPTEKNE